MQLSEGQKGFVMDLLEAGISEEIIGLMLYLLQEEEQKKMAGYIVDQYDAGVEITNSLVLKYLMGTMKGQVIDED